MFEVIGSETVIAVAQSLTALSTITLALVVRSYTKKKDALDYDLAQWNQQQSMNIASAQSDKISSSFEKLLYGADYDYDKEFVSKLGAIFYILNRININYLSYKSGIIGRRKFIERSIPTLRFLANERKLTTWALENRGYSIEFGNAVRDILLTVEPYRPYTSNQE